MDKETMDLCQEISVDLIGLNFSPVSKRKIPESKVDELLQNRKSPNFPKVVFLFYQNEESEIKDIVSKHSPDLVQLITDDKFISDQTWKLYSEKNQLLPAVRIKESTDNDSLPFPNANLMILDSFKKEEGGGTGLAFPWEYVSSITRPYLLAGGITPDNVAEALKTVQAVGIDVATGVETLGKKDPQKIEMLVKNVRRL